MASYRRNSKQYSRTYYEKNRQAVIDRKVRDKQIKKQRLVDEFGGACQRCGYARSAAALSFHHRDPATKEFEIGNVSYGIKRLRVEAAKCDLLCLNCHAEVETGCDP